ncbi:MAG: DUF4190 domain-containing protein [Deltaproteobacteria bacterium]|nr:MAG: DUF4190 domain-containing protein [Deltaproteobacteria bacterium]
MFYEMVTGTILFDGESTPQIMTRHVLNGPQFPEQWPAGVPEGLKEVLARALHKDPKQRFAAAGEFSAAIASLGPTAPAPKPVVPPVRPEVGPAPRRSTLALVSLVAGILGLPNLLLVCNVLYIFSIGPKTKNDFIFPLVGSILPLIASLVAVITGYKARKEIKTSGGRVTGNKQVIFGLVLGYLGLIIGIMLLCLMVFTQIPGVIGPVY